MYQSSTLTLQMFISCGGLNVLVDFLEEDLETERDLVLIGVNGIWSVFELQVRGVVLSILNFTKISRDQLLRMTFAGFYQGALSFILCPWYSTEYLTRMASWRT